VNSLTKQNLLIALDIVYRFYRFDLRILFVLARTLVVQHALRFVEKQGGSSAISTEVPEADVSRVWS
jgi:hypothetical protein